MGASEIRVPSGIFTRAAETLQETVSDHLGVTVGLVCRTAHISLRGSPLPRYRCPRDNISG